MTSIAFCIKDTTHKILHKTSVKAKAFLCISFIHYKASVTPIYKQTASYIHSFWPH